ncbi:MAG: peptidylprolyl isomerase [Alphaproteobacteria bacterium]
MTVPSGLRRGWRAAVAALLLLAGAAAPLAAQPAATRIAAVVNEDVISEFDLQARLRLVGAAAGIDGSQDPGGRFRAQVLRALIDERLQIQEASRANIRATDQEIADNITRLERQNNMPPGGFYGWLDQNNIARSTALDQIRANIVWTKLIRRRYGRTINVTEEEIDEAVQERRSAGTTIERRIAEIFLPIERPGEDDEVRRLAERLVEQMRTGVRFSQIARQFSQAATAAVGGDLGWVQPGQLAPELESAIAGLAPGELTPPLKLAGGFYILLLLDQRNPGAVGGGETAAAGEQTVGLRQIVVPLRPNSTAEQRAERRRLAEEISQSTKDCADMARRDDTAGVLSGDLGKVKLSDLPARLRQIVARQPIGKATAPIQVDAGFVVLMVCEREEAQRAEASPVNREQVSEALTVQRLENVARRVIRDLRRAAFIDIRS